MKVKCFLAPKSATNPTITKIELTFDSKEKMEKAAEKIKDSNSFVFQIVSDTQIDVRMFDQYIEQIDPNKDINEEQPYIEQFRFTKKGVKLIQSFDSKIEWI